jgi:hypothetical protein
VSVVDLEPPLAGYYISKTERVCYLPVIESLEEGQGHVGRLLERLQAEHDVVVISTVMSDRLRGMLERRDYRRETHFAAGFDDYVHCYVWRRPEELA